MTPQTLPRLSWPVLWHQLLGEMETLSGEHNLALENVWDLVHRNDYYGARELFDTIRDAVHPTDSIQLGAPQ